LNLRRFASLLLIAAAVQAQTAPHTDPPGTYHPESAGAFIRQIGYDQVRIWSSPFRMNRKQTLFIALPMAVGTAALIASDRHINSAMPNTPDQIRVAQDISRLGALYTLSAAVGVPFAIGAFTKNETALSVGAATSRALINSTAVSYGMKAIFWRDRPSQGNGHGNFWGGGDSFPSGHAISTFAVATALAVNPRVPKWVKITGFAAAAVVTLSRLPAQKHWASDIFVGSTLGIMIGRQAAGLPPFFH